MKRQDFAPHPSEGRPGGKEVVKPSSDGIDPPKPADVHQSQTTPDQPEWLKKALSDEYQKTLMANLPDWKRDAIKQLAGLDQPARDIRDERTGFPVPDPGPRPLHARQPRLTSMAFVGLTLDRSCERLGVPRGGESGRLLSKIRDFYLFKYANQMLANASAAPDTETTTEALRNVALCRQAIRVLLDTVETAESDVRRALGLTD